MGKLNPKRGLALITGAAGGMGRACARTLGATCDLVLTDLPGEGFDAFVATLQADDLAVQAQIAGPLGSKQVLDALAAECAGANAIKLVHTAGVSPALADWRTILEVNLVASSRLARRLGPVLPPGSSAVLIASMAGHTGISLPGAQDLLADPLAENFIDSMAALVIAATRDAPPGSAEGMCYGLSKKGVIDLVEALAADWGQRGNRIVSVSPGMIDTAMGQAELAATPTATMIARLTPAGRLGTAADIADAVRFLTSDDASFITGCDLRIDGGAIPALRALRG